MNPPGTRKSCVGTFAGVVGFAVTLMAGIPGAAPAADLEAGRRKAEPCGACHGADGNATNPGTPSLAGQPVFFTHWQMIKFRDGRRKDPQMSPLAQNLSDTDMADLAAYYQAQQPRPRPTATATRPRSPPARRSRCFIIAPPVTGPGSPGRSRCRAWPARTTTTPSGCSAGSKAKTASNLDGTMTIAARPLGDEEIVSLAHYIASLGAEP